jgi:hypothetical protein
VGFQSELKIRDGLEVAKRRKEKARVASLKPEEREIAQNVEDLRQRIYNDDRKRLIRAFNASPFQPATGVSSASLTSGSTDPLTSTTTYNAGSLSAEGNESDSSSEYFDAEDGEEDEFFDSEERITSAKILY